jgi:hypothetical protein
MYEIRSLVFHFTLRIFFFFFGWLDRPSGPGFTTLLRYTTFGRATST